MKKNLNNLGYFFGSLSGKISKSNLKYFLFFGFLLCGLNFVSQNEATKWYFGHHAGLDFMTNPPSVIPTSTIYTGEGSASIADGAGNTLFYTDGITVFDHNNDTLPNGTWLKGNGSTTQSGIIVKQPGNSNIYYVFTQDDIGGPDGFCYSVIDMSLAAGIGSVTTKNILLHTPSCEKITAVRHCNGVDVWVVSHDYNSNAFRTFLVTASGVNTLSPVISTVGTTINTILLTLGQMKISPNGRKLGLAIYDSGSNASQPYEIYDFDPATGIVSNQIVLMNTSENYGCEFSPDGTKFYGACYGSHVINQWDLCAGTSTAIAASLYTISTGTTSPCQMQLAVNGKIYISMISGVLSEIQSPNFSGVSCNYVNATVTFSSPSMALLGLPNFINSFFKPSPQPFTFSASCQNVDFYAPAAQGTVASGCSFATNSLISTVWNFGDPNSTFNNTSSAANPNHIFSAGGTYTVKLALNYACNTDTVLLPITVSAMAFSLTGFSTVCAKDQRIYTASGATSYSWSTGATTPTISLTTTVSTVYTVTAYGSGPNPCKAVKTFTVTVAKCTDIDYVTESDPFLKIYPNPSTGILTIETERDIQLSITNALGQVILESSYKTGLHSLDISSYKNGIYFVKSTSGSSSKITRLIKAE